MTKSGKIVKRVRYEPLASLDNILENFRKDMERALQPWHPSLNFPSLLEGQIRMPLCDMTDKGDRYELQLEVPGIDKNKINVKATVSSVEISAEKSEKMDEKKKDYVYSEKVP